MGGQEIYVTPRAVKFGDKIFYLQHISTTNIIPLKRRLSFELNVFLGAILVFLCSIAFPVWILSTSYDYYRDMVVFNLIAFFVSGFTIFIGIKERRAKINYALEMVYSDSNTQLFINPDKQFIREVQKKIDDALEERLRGGTYIFDNSSNRVRIEGNVVGSSVSGRDTNASALSVGADRQNSSQDILNAIKDIVCQSDDYVLEAIHSHFRKEAQKDSPNKDKLKQLWQEMVSMASDLAKLTDAFHKIFA